MQTFLPYDSFSESARCLDNKRLGKQRVECKQIYQALTTGKGWVHHPITKMWKNHEGCLLVYGVVVCEEWKKRGFKDTLLDYFKEELLKWDAEAVKYPKWFGYVPFHLSHQCNLVRKFPEHYQNFFPKADPSKKYLWYDMEKKQWFYKTAEMKKREYVKNDNL